MIERATDSLYICGCGDLDTDIATAAQGVSLGQALIEKAERGTKVLVLLAAKPATKFSTKDDWAKSFQQA